MGEMEGQLSKKGEKPMENEVELMSKMQLIAEVYRLTSQLSEAHRKLESCEAQIRNSEGLLRRASPEVVNDVQPIMECPAVGSPSSIGS